MMAFAADAPGPVRRRSPPVPAGLTLNMSSNLSSNNPFRKHALSPTPSPALSPLPRNTLFPTSPARQPAMSFNPFLDDSEVTASPKVRANIVAIPDDIFSDLSLLDRPSTNGASQPSNSSASRGMPPPAYRATDHGDRRPPRSSRGPGSPVKRDLQHPQRRRRASESSILEKDRQPRTERERAERPQRTESEERRRRERRREREERHKREKERLGTGEKDEKSDKSKKRAKKPQGLDLIDKLDVTGIYGQGVFHHDGPFDACNPHRNARKDRRAPMQAFPADSANMALGGAGPLNAGLDLDRFHGRGIEGFSEYAAARKAATLTFDPTRDTEPVHGQETFGLGTSTFLEGAPASKSALQRRESEDPALSGTGGLSRSKSLARRLRGMSASQRIGSADLRSPDARYPRTLSDADSPPPSQAQNKAVSAGGPVRARYDKENEINPFENDYEAAFEKKGTQIRIAEQEKPFDSEARPSSSSKAVGLTRSKTSEAYIPTRARGSSNEEERLGGGGGFLNRMRSIKGGSRKAGRVES